MSEPRDRPDPHEPGRGRVTLPDGMLPPGVEKDRRSHRRHPIEILVVIGTRPEAIKMVPLVQALHDHPALHPVVISTGQHRDLVEPILAMAGITADVDLGCGGPGITLNDLATSVMTGFDRYCRSRYGDPTGDVAELTHVVRDGYPGAVLVHGDTSSAMAAALSSFHLRLPVVHVEAGLRTYNTLTPFPEEMNRHGQTALWPGRCCART